MCAPQARTRLAPSTQVYDFFLLAAGFFATDLAADFLATVFFFAGILLLRSSASVDGRIIVRRGLRSRAGDER